MLLYLSNTLYMCLFSPLSFCSFIYTFYLSIFMFNYFIISI